MGVLGLHQISVEDRGKTGVYLITTHKPGNFCIGSSSRCIYTRMHQHRSDLRKNIHGNGKLQNYVNKYGVDNLNFYSVVECPPEVCILQEQLYIDEYGPILNINKQAFSRRDMKASEETLQKMRDRVVSEVTRAKIREARSRQKFSQEALQHRAHSIRQVLNTPISCSNGKDYESVGAASKDTVIPNSSICHVLVGRVKNPKHGLRFWYTYGKSNGATSRKQA